MMAIMAFACALLVEPLAPSQRTVAEHQNAAEQSAATGGLMPPSQHEDGVAQRPRVGGERWGENIEWPQEWRKPREPRKPGRE